MRILYPRIEGAAPLLLGERLVACPHCAGRMVLQAGVRESWMDATALSCPHCRRTFGLVTAPTLLED